MRFIVSKDTYQAREWIEERLSPQVGFLIITDVQKLNGYKVGQLDLVYLVGDFKDRKNLDEILVKLGERGWDGVPADWPPKVTEEEIKKEKKVVLPLKFDEATKAKLVQAFKDSFKDSPMDCGNPSCDICHPSYRQISDLQRGRAPVKLRFTEMELMRMSRYEMDRIVRDFTRYEIVDDPVTHSKIIYGYYD